MSPAVFTINFRRELYQRELARSRARVLSLGVWLSYFGALVVIFGLYGLNCAAIAQRTRMVERQGLANAANRGDRVDWTQKPAEMALIERGVTDGRRWQQRLTRIALVLPANARLTSLEFNPGGISGAGDWNRLVLSGVLRAAPDQDRMRGVTDLVSALQRDSLLTAHFHSIRLASTRITETAGQSTEFVVECRP
jgi:hypothetical protein